tara:strand:+ start:558 stop:1283 length:726 start_codon:yes stop_codon:yes gene_type:complete
MNHLDLIKRNLFKREEVKEAFGFGGSFYINCKRSRERRKLFEAEAASHGIRPLRVEGFEPTEEEVEALGFTEWKLKRRVFGQVGCAVSHFTIIAEAKRLGLPSVLIFEDDATFCEGWEKGIEHLSSELEAMEHVLDWDMVYLGGVPHGVKHPRISSAFFRSLGMWCTHAYAVHEAFFDSFLEWGTKQIASIDSKMFHQAHLFNFLFYREPLNFQRDGESLIAGRQINRGGVIQNAYDSFPR